nr:MAG: capsid protein [Cressdnaviricota sp.]
MPRRRISRRRSRVSHRPRRTGRKRFARKKFRSTPNMTKVKGTSIGKNAMVKLTYSKEFAAAVTAVGGGLIPSWTSISTPFGSGARTYPVLNTPASMALLGSHCCTPFGSGTAAWTEDYPAALTDWSAFYEQALCFGSSISIQIMPFQSDSSTGAQTDMRYILLAIASESIADLDDVNDNGTAGITKLNLDALPYESLATYPGARTGYIRSSFSGITRVKAFRKTKSMLGLKDLRDNQELSMTLPTNASLNTGQNYVAGTSPHQLAWIWYFRLFTFDGTPAGGQNMYTIRLNYYLQLQSRRFILQETANS